MSERGRYAHGRDKDEWFIRAYDRGWQAWWFVAVAFVLLTLVVFWTAFVTTRTLDRARRRDVRQAYEQGYRDGFVAGSTKRDHPDGAFPEEFEPSPALPGSGAPAPDSPTTSTASRPRNESASVSSSDLRGRRQRASTGADLGPWAASSCSAIVLSPSAMTKPSAPFESAVSGSVPGAAGRFRSVVAAGARTRARGRTARTTPGRRLGLGR